MAVFSGKFQTVALLLSTGRTGTKALAQYFDTSFAEVCALHEPAPSRHLRVASNRYLCGRLAREQMVKLFADARRDRVAAISEPIYIESNPFLHGFVDVLDDVFEAPRVVHIVRDPRSYVRSYINYGAFRGIKGLAARLYPYWMLKPEQVDPAAPRRWTAMSQVERLAWRWATINASLDRGASIFGERYVRVRFEDLFAEDGSGLRWLAERIGLRPSAQFERLREERVNASTGRQMPKWEQWDAADRRALMELCGPQMDRYGYGAADAPAPPST